MISHSLLLLFSHKDLFTFQRSRFLSYFLTALFLHTIQSPTVTNSANGIASQTPYIPHNRGSIISDATIQTNVLLNEISAEVFPSDNAVK